MDLLDKFTNLLVMAAADGSLTDREIRFLLNRSARWGISEKEFSLALEHALSKKAELRIPTQSKERVAMLQDLIRVMAADGHLGEIEKQLFATAAAKMSVAEDELNKIIDEVIGSG